jgi:hypothetical protein
MSPDTSRTGVTPQAALELSSAVPSHEGQYHTVDGVTSRTSQRISSTGFTVG